MEQKSAEQKSVEQKRQEKWKREDRHMYADYSNSLVNLSCSVLKRFGAEYGHQTLPCADNWMEKGYRNVVVILLDGMGCDAMNYHLKQDGFFRKYYRCAVSSVFPPTTTAATTTMESGLTPAEHGWLGWSLYFSEIQKIVNAFTNQDQYERVQAEDYHVASRYIPYTKIYEKINRAGVGHGYSVSHFGTNKIETLDELCGEVQRLCGQEGEKYIYAYWEEPDSIMHDTGCRSESVTANMRYLEQKIAEMSHQLEDTLLIVTADHGHIDLSHYILTDYPDILEMLRLSISVEARAAAFYVKEGCEEEFSKRFCRHFGEEFLLFSAEEMLEWQIFGDGVPHEKFRELAGDFLAVGIAHKGFAWSRNLPMFLSNHAGMTEQEMIVPLIVVEKP